jgi:hypothetical protein
MLLTIVSCIINKNLIEHIKILKLILEKKPDLMIKNRNGLTPVEITNSKIIIALFWHYLTGKEDALEVSQKLVVDITAPSTPAIATDKPKTNPKYALETIKMKEPEVPKIHGTKQKETKAILIGPKSVPKKVFRYSIIKHRRQRG